MVRKKKKPVEGIEMTSKGKEEAVSAASHVEAKPSAEKTASVESPSYEKVAGKRKNKESHPLCGKKRRQMIKMDHEVFVAKLKYSTTKNSIQEHFSQFGEVANVGLPMSCKTYNKGFAFVAFKEASSLEKALAKSDQQIDSANIVLNAGEKPAAKEKPYLLFPNRLFIWSLDLLTEKPTVEQHFSKYGKVVNVSVPWKKEECKNKGFGFVSFESVASVKKALEEDHEIDGKVVCIKISEETRAVSQKIKSNELEAVSAVEKMADNSEEDENEDGDKEEGVEGEKAAKGEEVVKSESDDAKNEANKEDGDDAVENVNEDERR